jgi:hypothetical protein
VRVLKLRRVPENIAVAKTFISCTREHRMVWDPVFDGKPTEPAIGEIHSYITAQRPFRANCKNIADDKHPEHQHRVDRGSAHRAGCVPRRGTSSFRYQYRWRKSNVYNPNVAIQLRETEDAVARLKLQSHVVEAHTPEEFARAFARLSAESVNGVVLLAHASVIEHAGTIAQLAQAARLPTAFQRRENVDTGGLMCYGANLRDQFRQAAFYVDHILKGAKPAHLPVQQPTKLEIYYQSEDRQGARP